MGAELTESLGQWNGMPTLLLAANSHSAIMPWAIVEED
jgi:hypothetical protein